MSGTSMDGLDIAFCSFEQFKNRWEYVIEKAITVPYDSETNNLLNYAYLSSGRELTVIDYRYGKWIGQQVAKFLDSESIIPDFIASHGHTIFHEPQSGYTLQIGKGSAIASETNIPCICDFRSGDICRGGQGAPLVPIGDRHLFPDYDSCLNLGGFSNISFEKHGARIAFDISPCNIALNYFAHKLGHQYDDKGQIGKKASVDKKLLDDLNSIEYYHKDQHKSLGREWFEKSLLNVIDQYTISVEDVIGTLYEHISLQIVNAIEQTKTEKVLVTGGGAKNDFLIHLLKTKSKREIVIPDPLTVDFKEALIFAFLGVLYLTQQVGALKSVTGASKDTIAGCLYY